MSWEKVKLGSVLQQYRITHLVQDATVYKQVTISKHDGVCYRGTKIGKEIGRKRQFIIDLKKYPNTFMFVRQGVSDGALGIAPPEVDNCIATENMPMFAVKGIEVDYLNLLLKSIDFKRQLDQIPTLGSAQKAIHERQLLEIEIPLPSADEQREIVKAFEEHRTNVLNIFVETDQQLTHLTQLRQALLREAMQGQLLPQDPTDEPAAVLLQKLQAEKAKLGKAGKQTSLIKEEETLPELPQGWSWVRLGDIADMCLGKMLDMVKNQGELQPYMRNTNVRWGSFDLDDLKLMRFTKSEDARFSVKKGDLVICEGGEPGRAAIWYGDEPIKIQKALHRVRPNVQFLSSEFLYYKIYLDAQSKALDDYFTGAGIQHLTGRSLGRYIIPLPPLAEQHRIVAKLEQLMQYCDALEQRIRESRRLAEQLLQTALREALAPPVDAEIPADDAEPELAEADAVPARRGRPAGKAAQPGRHAGFGSLFD